MKQLLQTPAFTIGGFLLFAVLLFLYSFTQIDLSLTLSSASLFQTIQKSFQFIGYFNRPLSAQLYLFIVIGMFLFFLLLLHNLQKKNISVRTIWQLICTVTVLLLFAYNAFSYDVFNYIFDAKIVTHYQENPYVKKALDFPGDPMLSFMHWTHRVYPYGPVWLGLTIPLSFLGMQKFVVTFFLFKLLMGSAFLGTVYFLYKIVKKIAPEHAVFAATAFALNPFTLIESLISAHNDIVMLFFAVVALYFLVIKKSFPALLFLFLSIGIKFATVLLLPLFLYVLFLDIRHKTVQWERIFYVMLITMMGAVIAASLRTNFQPWYLLYPMPFFALLSNRRSALYPMVILSITALGNYLPFLYTGNWDPPIPDYLAVINIAGVSMAAVSMWLSRFSVKSLSV
jgi:hypothetical protein